MSNQRYRYYLAEGDSLNTIKGVFLKNAKSFASPTEKIIQALGIVSALVVRTESGGSYTPPHSVTKLAEGDVFYLTLPEGAANIPADCKEINFQDVRKLYTDSYKKKSVPQGIKRHSRSI